MGQSSNSFLEVGVAETLVLEHLKSHFFFNVQCIMQ